MKRILAGLTDVIFPPRCISCEKVLRDEVNYHFCLDCFSEINFVKSPICTICGIPFTGNDQTDHICGDCLKSLPGSSITRCVGRYETVLLHAIHEFKYREKISIGEMLGKLMADFNYPAFSIPEYSLIVPVPLHLKRLRQRGFNQSLTLAREIAKKFSLSIDFMTLKRRIYTEPQVNLGRNEREANVKNAFEVKDSGNVRGKKIILVDDVITTGNTVKECARVLMDCQAQEVAILSLARAL